MDGNQYTSDEFKDSDREEKNKEQQATVRNAEPHWEKYFVGADLRAGVWKNSGIQTQPSIWIKTQNLPRPKAKCTEQDRGGTETRNKWKTVWFGVTKLGV